MFDGDLIYFLLIVISLVLSAFFSASETAITSLGALKTRHLIEKETGFDGHLRMWLEEPRRVITTILIFNNVVNIMVSVLTTFLTSKYFSNNAIGVAMGAITFAILVFGEVIPKSLASANAQPVARFSLRIIRWCYAVTYPLVWILSWLADYLIQQFRGEDDPPPVITEDEIEFLIEKGEGSRVIEDTKRDMIAGIFDIDETKVREVMTPRTDLVALDIEEADFEAAVKEINQSGHSRIPIYKDKMDEMVGIILAKDILKSLAGERPEKLEDLARDIYFVPESKPIIEVFKELKRTKNHIAVVVDEYGGTAGIVTMEDILEEIVGEIQDEHDNEEGDITQTGLDTYVVQGSMNLQDFFEHFKLDSAAAKQTLNDSDVDTIGGFVTELLSELPRVGQKIVYQNYRLKVIKVQSRRIEKIRVVRTVEIEPETKIV